MKINSLLIVALIAGAGAAGHYWGKNNNVSQTTNTNSASYVPHRG